MNVIVADTVAMRLRGLFWRKGFTGALLLTSCNDVHTCGMRQPIDIAFLAADGMVLESHCRVGPWRRLRCPGAASTLERFASNSPWLEPGECFDLKDFVVTALEGGQQHEGLSGMQGGCVR